MKMHVVPALLVIMFAVVLRLLPHPANVAPIAALGLFGGTYFDKKFALLVPIVALFVSDIFLGFYPGMPVVYGSFLLIGCIGLWLKKHKTIWNTIGASLASSTLFYLLTNLNYWYVSSLYPKTLVGVSESYINALPFFRNTLVGDLLYVGLLFGSYEVLRSLFHIPASKKAHL